MPEKTVLVVRCVPEDLLAFDAAAVANGFTRTDSDEPNRSQWVLALLRNSVEQTFKMPVKDVAKSRKERNAKVRSRTQRPSASRPTAADTKPKK